MYLVVCFFVAQARHVVSCLHEMLYVGRKNMEYEVRNVRVRNRVGVSLLDYKYIHQIHSYTVIYRESLILCT